jgi:hypothetical protein
MLGLPGFIVLVVLWVAAYALALWLHRRGTVHWDWHRDVLAVGALLLVVLAFFWPLFFTESWIPKGGGDLSSFIYPIYAYAARWLKRGIVPLWNPHLYLGMPFAADNQSGLFYPINLLFFLLTPELTYEAVELMAVTHVFLAGLFAYLLLRDLPSPRKVGTQGGRASIGRIAAVGGAVAYMLSDLFVVHPGNLNIIATAAWLPLALFCFRRALARPGWGWVAWSGLVLGVAALVGHAQMFLYLVASLGLYVLFALCVNRQEGWRAEGIRIAKAIAVGGIAFGLAALSLIPALDLTQYTVRASLSYEDASAFSLHPAGLISLLVPGFWGRGTGPFWGPWLRTEMGYVGVLPLMLAVTAVPLTVRRYKLTWFWLSLATFGLVVSLGEHTALHGWLYALFPPFRQLRVPARAIYLFDFAVAMLAATGLDALLHPLRRSASHTLGSLSRAYLWIWGATALVGVTVLGHAALVSRGLSPDLQAQNANSLGSTILFLMLFAAGLGLLSLRRYRLVSPVVLGVLAVALIAVDLIALGWNVEIEPNDPLKGYEHDDALAFLRADPEVYRVETDAQVQGGWAPDWALIHEMDDVSGIWNPLRLGAYDVLTWIGIDRDSRFYDLYNAKYLIARKDTSVPSHFEPALEDGDRIIYRNTRVLPRAFMVYRAQTIGGDVRALNTARGPEFDPATEVVLKKGPGAAPLDVDPGDSEPRVEIVDRGPNHLDFGVSTPTDGYLVVSEMWLPGWVAYVDGDKQDVLKANYTFRAVHVPAGNHDIHMAYEPRLWPVGLGLSLLTLLVLVTWGVWALWRRSKRTAHRAAT